MLELITVEIRIGFLGSPSILELVYLIDSGGFPYRTNYQRSMTLSTLLAALYIISRSAEVDT